jgi:hypothetical protein
MITQFSFESLRFDEFDENDTTKLRTTRKDKLKLGIWSCALYGSNVEPTGYYSV